jgi:formamidopyrimidine-DNA glycosylase
MPELPEVETIKNELSPHVVGQRISGVTLFWERMVRQPSAEEFRSRIAGRRITGLSRRGKYLIFDLDDGETLILHLRMSGALIVGKDTSEPAKYIRAIIHLENGENIFFRDLRKFGVMYLVRDRNSVVGKLGPEPFANDFTPELLTRRLAGRKAPVKALLCDQNFVAGVGNMYADEALFAARIHPLREGASLSQQEIKKLHGAIKQVLQAGIGNKGASTNTYMRPDGTRATAHS